MEQRIAAFVESPAIGAFEPLAADAAAFQLERVAPLRELCARRGIRPSSIDDWRHVPMVPTLAFKSLLLAADPAREIFESSGTRGTPSVHHHPYPDLYRAVIDASFPPACLAGTDRPPTLSLVPGRTQAPRSSLAFLTDHVLTRFGGDGSRTAFGARGVDLPAARSWLGARQRDRRPALLLATAFALAQLLDGLERLGLRFRLPTGSRIFETGGFKGRERELDREDLLCRLEEWLAVPPERVVREYGMTELTSSFYTGVLAGGDRDLFLPPHWARVRILDPESLEEAAPGETGLIAVFDLANVGSALHVLTEDLGRAEDIGFRLLGRAAGAELRGCSLVVEELSA